MRPDTIESKRALTNQPVYSSLKKPARDCQIQDTMLHSSLLSFRLQMSVFNVCSLSPNRVSYIIPPSFVIFSSFITHTSNLIILMSRTCQLTGRGTKTGNNRSHSNIATRRTFKVNIQTKRLNGVKLRISSTALRTLAKSAK